jgi:hypothetical protein
VAAKRPLILGLVVAAPLILAASGMCGTGGAQSTNSSPPPCEENQVGGILKSSDGRQLTSTVVPLTASGPHPARNVCRSPTS